jgi:hypothetical protein
MHATALPEKPARRCSPGSSPSSKASPPRPFSTAPSPTPQNPRRLEALRLDIEELAEQDPVFREQLARLLQAARAEQPSVNTQTSTVTGHGNTVMQVSGSNNTVGRQ